MSGKDKTKEQLENEMRELHQRLIETEARKIRLENDLEKLRVIEERNRRLLETMDEGVILTDLAGNIIHANPAAERILGLTRSQIELRNYISSEWEIIRPDGTPMPSEEMAGPLAMTKKVSVRDIVMGVKHPDGNVIWITVSATPLMSKTNELEGIVGTFTDITKLKKIEEEHRRLQENLQDALTKVINKYLPICSSCKRIRDDEGIWHEVEVYIRDHSEFEFSHSLCLECARDLYPGFEKESD